MDMVLLGYAGIAIMLALSVAGMPMAYAMCIVASAGMCFTLGPINAATQTMFVAWEQASNFSLMSIPLFIFMGSIAYHTGIVSDLFVAFRRWIGFLPGGLAAAGIMAAASFGAVTGSTAAASATMASTVIPELEKASYSQSLASGAIAASGGLAAIIPPSVFVIIYAALTDQSAGEMFIAILGPGMLTTVLFSLYCIIRCCVTPSLGPKQPSASWKERIQCLPAAIPVMVTFAIVIGSIYGGLATPTEAAAFGCIGVMLIAFCMGRLKKDLVIPAFKEGAKMSAAIFFLFIGGWLMARFMVTTGTTRHMVQMFVGFEMSHTTLLVCMFVLFLILGCILESTSILVLTMPFMFPITQQYGLDPVWFGVFVTVMLVLAGVSPPVGLNVFVVRSVCPHIPIVSIYKGAAPFILILIITVVAICVWPEIVMAPVHSMMGSIR
ncbi:MULTISPECIES: TRAP transporter large permease [unclassified Desulfovibrio]|uniref:TRAP transporter large permease n=1 Tax=unclassified Desulfovibrio TaxID=2593640 RepID=UPI000F5F1D77|nr:MULTISPECIES: TRAP transporter large permease [unclassified Desulfovibrio]RRD71895.1 TRAP transporter large permease [Desulfovibrio sp. OH1209_COT-279]RRD88108.1 TRAP transporter large permease [Desulfovibrio sp. OH1186_COT-070]